MREDASYLQFPPLDNGFIDARLLEPVSVTSNVPDSTEHPAAYAIDESSRHYWEAVVPSK